MSTNDADSTLVSFFDVTLDDHQARTIRADTIDYGLDREAPVLALYRGEDDEVVAVFPLVAVRSVIRAYRAVPQST